MTYNFKQIQLPTFFIIMEYDEIIKNSILYAKLETIVWNKMIGWVGVLWVQPRTVASLPAAFTNL